MPCGDKVDMAVDGFWDISQKNTVAGKLFTVTLV